MRPARRAATVAIVVGGTLALTLAGFGLAVLLPHDVGVIVAGLLIFSSLWTTPRSLRKAREGAPDKAKFDRAIYGSGLYKACMVFSATAGPAAVVVGVVGLLT